MGPDARRLTPDTQGESPIAQHFSRIAHRASLLFAASILSSVAAAQDAVFLKPPEPILFSDWTRVGETPISFAYETSFPSPLPSGVAANDTVPLQVWIPSRREGPFPAVILLHYWGAGDIRSERNTAQELCRRGIAGIVLHLPYHLRRTPPGTRSGELAIVAKPEAMIRTMSQGVLDVRRAVDWIASRPEFDKEKIGIAGTSLGAIVASVAASVEPRLKFAAFVLGGADLAHILWNSSRVVKQRDEMRRDGLTEARLREVLKPIEPLRYLPEAKLQGSFVIGARYDSVIPAQDTQKLIDALDKPKSVWLDTGHYGGFLIQKQVQRAAAAFFASEFSGRAYVPPKRITAPTVRVGAQLNSDNGLEVALGLDIWRGTARGDTFASVLVTPSELQLFVGFQSTRGLAIGVSADLDGVRPSVLWSIVL